MNLKKILFIGLIALTSAVAVSLSLIGYEHYLRELPENTSVHNISVSGLNRPEVFEKLQPALQQWNDRKFVIVLNEEAATREFTSQDLGITFDLQKTISNIFRRTGWFAIASSSVGNTGVYKPVIVYDETKMKQVVAEFILSPESDPQNAEIVWANNGWFIKNEVPGLAIKKGEFDRILTELKTSSENLSSPEKIQIAYEVVEPLKKSPELEQHLKNIQERVSKPVVMMIENEKKELSLLDSSEWITVNSLDQTIHLNEAFAQQKVENISKDLDILPGAVVVTGVEEHLSEYDKKVVKKAVYTGDFTRGRTINREKILSALRDMVNDPSLERKIVLEWETISPSVSSQVEGYSFPQILSTGISSFRLGNHPNRVKNIKLSLGSFQGVIVEPGEEFSFNRVTGWITPQKGYTKTQVIMEGKVEEGVGGGVCQSSTTVYRSILNAGVTVTERRNHSLDVVYYHDYGYGLDAAVYTDSRNDLKFINNFPGPIMINTYTDDFKKEAYVEFYGVTDERRVELTQINTGKFLLKKWDWKIIWPDRVEEHVVQSIYQLPKEEEDKPANPLEA